jgi:5-methylcytosine-specific restriction endonuclease McrA
MSKTYIPVALRRLVYDRANGACEYCWIPESATLMAHEVDHVIAEKHGGKTDESPRTSRGTKIINAGQDFESA